VSRTTEILLYVDPNVQRQLEDLSFWLRDQAPRTDDRVGGTAGSMTAERDRDVIEVAVTIAARCSLPL